MNQLHVKKGDTVILRVGSEYVKGARKTGKVVTVSPKEGKVIVEGMNKVKKHVKPTKMGQPGGIIEAEAPIYACKVQVVCPKCNKPTRVGHSFKEVKGKDGEMKSKKVRVCKHKECGAELG